MSGIGAHTKPIRGLSQSWITPRHILSALGTFDLDPCAANPQPWPCATRSYVLPQDGLTLPWKGRVWLNPPYGDEAWAWLERLSDHPSGGTALIFARTETKMFVSAVWSRATAILFIDGRLTFHRTSGRPGKGNSGGPSCLVAYGGKDAALLSRSKIPGAYVRLWRANG